MVVQSASGEFACDRFVLYLANSEWNNDSVFPAKEGIHFPQSIAREFERNEDTLL